MRRIRASNYNWSRWWLTALALSGGLFLIACEGGEPDPAQIRGLAAVEVEPGAMEFRPRESRDTARPTER